MVTVSTDGSDSCVRVEHYSGNPHPEVPLPANALNKFNDVLVGDANAVIWPMHVEISYTDAEISALINRPCGCIILKARHGTFARTPV